jgi:hypothetical protein
MSKLSRKTKKLRIVLATLAVTSTLGIQEARADQVDVPYLTNIQNYTNSMLTVINQLPAYFSSLPTLVTTMLAADNASSDPVPWTTYWTNQQTWLTTLGSNALNNEANAIALQTSLLTTFFGSSNISAGTPQNMNDLSFSTLLGNPLLSPDPRSGANAALNYLTNASGLNLTYPVPSAGWRGSSEAQKAYTQFYNTVTAVQTYNAYALSHLYEDSQTLVNDTALRKQLITQTTNANWFSSVIANDLGWVFRQILLYCSQTYVLMDQLVQTQKQMAATLAMTNTLLIANSGFQANTLMTQAKGG